MNTFPLFAARGAPHVAATLTTAFGTANSNLKYTAVTPGAAGNLITVEYKLPTAPETLPPISTAVVGNAIAVTVATNGGTQQVLRLTLTGSVTGSGTARVTFSSARFSTFSVDWSVTSGDSLTTVRNNMLTACNASASYLAIFPSAASVGATAMNVRCHSASQDVTLTASVSNVTSTGLGTGTNSNAVTGVAPVVTSTAANVSTSVSGSGAASALVTVANAPGNDGTGVVSTLAATNLSGGS